jgi:hypothetical protein
VSIRVVGLVSDILCMEGEKILVDAAGPSLPAEAEKTPRGPRGIVVDVVSVFDGV